MISLFEDATMEKYPSSVKLLEFDALEQEPEVDARHLQRTEDLQEMLQAKNAELEAVQATADAALEHLRQEKNAACEKLQQERSMALSEARSQVEALIENFAAERNRYFKEIERQVVLLSLSIAEHILHREIAIDPLLLRSAVRVALEGVAADDEVSLRVPVGSGGAWELVLAEVSAREKIRIIEDEKLAAGEASIETTAGKAQLGVQEQLREIERGFFDLLQKRPDR